MHTADKRLNQPADKRLNEMDRLTDMGHFPPAVNAGATANILFTLLVTWWMVPHLPQRSSPFFFVGLVLCLNLLPVILLRRTIRRTTPFPTLQSMNFFRDQHKFSPWVYAAASANMAFWILFGWAAFSLRYKPSTLVAVLAIAFLCTFSPILLRRGRS